MDADGDEEMNDDEKERSSGALESSSAAIFPLASQGLAQGERSKGDVLMNAEISSMGSPQDLVLAAKDSAQISSSRDVFPVTKEAPGEGVEPQSILPPVHIGDNGVKEVGVRADPWKNILSGDQGMSDTQVIAVMSVLARDSDELYDTMHCVKYHLGNFEGISRRFELVGKVKQCYIYDDYAHHPTEICAVLQGARDRFPCQEIIVVFQPHTFSRLAAMIEEFAAAFSVANHVIVTEVYAAREMNTLNISGKDLVVRITGSSSEYIPVLA